MELGVQSRRAPNLNCGAAVSELPRVKPSRQWQLVVHDHISVLVFDPEPPSWVTCLLPAVGVDCFHRAVWILPLLVLSGVDLLLASVEVDLLGAVPAEESEGETESLKASHGFSVGLARYSRADLDDGAVHQHALLPAVWKHVLHCLVWESDFFSPVWKMFLWSRKVKLCNHIQDLNTAN